MSSEREYRDGFAGARRRSLCTPSVRVTETLHEASEYVPMHVHATTYVTMVVEGGYVERCGGRADSCTPGLVVVHGNGEVHEDRFGSRRTRLLNLEWSDGSFDIEAGEGNRLVVGRAVERIAANLIAELGVSDFASGLGIDSLSAELAALAQAPNPLAGSAPPWLERVVDRIRSEYQAPLDLAGLAAEAGVHKSHLARVFRRHLGMTAGDYVRRMRIDWAKVRLRQGAEPSDVGYGAGFADQSHFTRWFRRLTGVTPARWTRIGGRSGSDPKSELSVAHLRCDQSS